MSAKDFATRKYFHNLKKSYILNHGKMFSIRPNVRMSEELSRAKSKKA